MKIFGSITKLFQLIFQSGSYTGTMQPTTLTADRTYTLPDSSDTIATQTYATTASSSAASSAVGTHAALTATHGVSGALVGTTDSQVLTNKTLQEDLVDNFLAINHENDPAAASAGTVRLYAKSDNSLYTIDPNGVVQPVGSSSGQGEKNYITNGSAKSAITGWVASDAAKLSIARTTTAAELPREYTTASGIKMLSVASADSTNAYVYYDFSLDDVDCNKKLKIQWSQKLVGAYASGDLSVYIASQADRTTALHTPVTTLIPNAEGVFYTSFDSASTQALSLVIKAPGNMADNVGLVISDVVVGPGTQPQGAVVGEWQSYTPSITGNGSKVTTTLNGRYRRVGDSMELRIYYAGNATASGAGGTVVQFSIPAGYTIDSSKTNSTFPSYQTNLGTATDYGINSATAYNYAATVFPYSSTNLAIFDAGTAAEIRTSALNVANTVEILIEATIPIAEWSGSGTVNLAQNDVEYASNSNTTTNADNETDFVYGPAGSAIINFSTSGTTGIKRRVKFKSPIQAGDQLIVETAPSSLDSWESVIQRGYGFAQNDAGSTLYGILAVAYSSTEVDVYFYSAPFKGASWSGHAGNRWRVRKTSAGAAVGFGLATTDSAGLVGTGSQVFSGNKGFTGFVNIGSGAPGLKCKRIDGSTNSSEGGNALISHGLTSTKIVSATCVVYAGASNLSGFPPGNTVAGYQYDMYWDSTQFVVSNHATNSENILSKSVTILAWYVE